MVPWEVKTNEEEYLFDLRAQVARGESLVRLTSLLLSVRPWSVSMIFLVRKPFAKRDLWNEGED